MHTQFFQFVSERTIVDRQTISRRIWLVVLLGVAVSCLSPTLPLPPPDRPTIEGPDSSGNVTLSGITLRGANVYSDNLVTGASAGQKADTQTGAYKFKIPAQVGDDMVLFYRYESESSNRLYFTIPNPVRTTNLADSGTIYADAGTR